MSNHVFYAICYQKKFIKILVDLKTIFLEHLDAQKWWWNLCKTPGEGRLVESKHKFLSNENVNKHNIELSVAPSQPSNI